MTELFAPPDVRRLLFGAANVLLALLFAPLLPGVINRTKALFAGRTGAPLLQPYYDLAKLLRKGAVFSRTTTILFRAGPVLGLAGMICAAAFVPSLLPGALLAFEGGVVFFAGLLALVRLATVLAALDTGSSFEGMGASREVQIAALAEPALLLGLGTLVALSGSTAMGTILSGLSPVSWAAAGPSLLLVAGAFVVVFLAENARLPVDDPNTHLELTMIHEVMVLDHSGPDLAFIHYGAALKLWVLGSLVVALVAGAVPLPSGDGAALVAGALLRFAGLLAVAVLVGALESSLARLRMNRVPHLLVTASALSGLALLLVLR